MEILNKLVELKTGYNNNVLEVINNNIKPQMANKNIVEVKLCKPILNKETAYITIKRVSLFGYMVEVTINNNTNITSLGDYVLDMILNHENNNLEWHNYLFIDYFNL